MMCYFNKFRKNQYCKFQMIFVNPFGIRFHDTATEDITINFTNAVSILPWNHNR